MTEIKEVKKTTKKTTTKIAKNHAKPSNSPQYSLNISTYLGILNIPTIPLNIPTNILQKYPKNCSNKSNKKSTKLLI